MIMLVSSNGFGCAEIAARKFSCNIIPAVPSPREWRNTNEVVNSFEARGEVRMVKRQNGNLP